MPYALFIGGSLLVLWMVSGWSYLLFHSLVELFSIGIAWGLFIVAWNTRRIVANGFFLTVGVAYVYTGLLDLLHILAYKGMGIFPDDGDLPTQFWMAARLLESVGLAAALLVTGRSVAPMAPQLTLGLACAALGAAIFAGWFPTTYVEGAGLTPFKIVGEYAVVGMFAVSGLLLWRHRNRFDGTVLALLAGFVGLRIASEMAFTIYGTFFDRPNLIGHLLKVAGFYLLYRATIHSTLKNPYTILFRELHSARDALRFKERRFRQALGPAPVMVFSQDAELRYDWAYNVPAATAARGGDIVGLRDSEVFSAEDARLLLFVKQQALDTRRTVRRQLQLTSAGDRWFDLTVEPLLDNDGQAKGVVGTAIDITELVRARAEAEAANHAKSRFLAAASHDLRQPFQAMRLFHHMLSARLEEPLQRQLATKLADAMEAGEGLLKALLDISILDAGTLRPSIERFPIRDVIVSVATEFEPQAAANNLKLKVADSSLEVVSDRTLLARMVRNLMANALRYTREGGILLGCRRGPGHLKIVVADTGIGIPSEKLSAIFDDFYQIGNPERCREQGLGLGLAVVERVGRLLGHKVTVASQVGRGSLFAITVPLAGDLAIDESQGRRLAEGV